MPLDSVTISQAKQAKADLETTITQALRQFSDRTGATVVSVYAEPTIVLGSPANYRVDVEARL